VRQIMARASFADIGKGGSCVACVARPGQSPRSHASVTSGGWQKAPGLPISVSTGQFVARRPVAQVPVRAFASRQVERRVARRRCTDKGDTDAEDL